MTFAKAILMAIVQGLTEFLPVSSKAHLAFTAALLHLPKDMQVDFEVTLHFGTLLAVVAFYWRDLGQIFKAVLTSAPQEEAAAALHRDNRRLFWLLLLATIPAAFVGKVLEHWVEANLYHPLLHGCGLVYTAAILFFASRLKGGKQLAQTTWKDALTVGLFQASALLPGVSRSGSCITGGLVRGMDREWAPRFGFLMSIPIVLGAFVLKLHEMMKTHVGLAADPATYLVSVLVAAVTGYLAIRLVINSVKRGNLVYFSIYCLVVGITAIVLSSLYAAS